METSGRSEPEACPICYEPLRREAYLDRCFHAFCYHCIVQWSEFVKEKYCQSAPSVKCPLCKVENFSIVYSFDGESFRRFYLNGDCQDSFFTSGHEFRLQCYRSEPGNIFNVQRYWKHHRYRQKNIWLPSWLRREIQTLTKEEDVDIIFHHVHGVIEAFFRSNQENTIKLNPEKRQENFRALLVDAAMPFLGGKTERFISELELFLASALTIEAYDRVYMHHLENYSSIEVSSQDHIVDSD
ncbi:uncharacterized protein LOC110095954 [Dendrobium catenatum]|uniref:E3 ubiquitin-protein ligase Topors n=1 Tax=Dendrobium catenatum TaxID=906689 RepID=A0A2I0VJC2_9ASPA|nr:uncharacterized protein LOC110095954 [Dendrobium catenatum]PKU63463.1 E3 ubiquitin-protein ligase Topors [Dendrobium catenatum]